VAQLKNNKTKVLKILNSKNKTNIEFNEDRKG
jgi:hypothetical protein